MRRFERRHVGAIPAGGTFRLVAQIDQSSALLTRRLRVRFPPSRPLLPDRLTSRTTDFESVYGGANPPPAAILFRQSVRKRRIPWYRE